MALGLVVPVIQNSQVRTTIVNRTPDNSQSATRCNQLSQNKGYQLSVNGKNERVNDVCSFYFDDPLPKELIASPALLITTAVTAEALPKITPYLSNLLQKRFSLSGDDSFTYIIACENLRDNSSKLKDELRRHALNQKLPTDFDKSLASNCGFLNTVVDRICLLPESHATNQTDVRTEEYFEWVVDISTIVHHPTWTKFLKETFDDNWRIVSNPEFSFFEKRKAWFVNGGHLILATLASSYQDKHLDRVLAKKEVSGKLDINFKAFSYALDYYRHREGMNETAEMSVPGNIQYGAKVKERFSKSHDTSTRIYKDLIKADKAVEELHRTLKELNAKVPDPTAVRESVKSLTRVLDINQFTGRIVSRIVEAIDTLLEYDGRPDGAVLKKEPEMAAEVIRLYGMCLKLMDSELKRTAKTLSEALDDNKP